MDKPLLKTGTALNDWGTCVWSCCAELGLRKYGLITMLIHWLGSASLVGHWAESVYMTWVSVDSTASRRLSTLLYWCLHFISAIQIYVYSTAVMSGSLVISQS